MARYFASDGWNDITLAVPFNIREYDDLINLLTEQTNLTISILIDNIHTAIFFKEKYMLADQILKVFIKIDVGLHRCGIQIMSETGEFSDQKLN